ncbi:MAG: tRNA lysidine(34) synthetase TilS [Opitutae bacterium]
MTRKAKLASVWRARAGQLGESLPFGRLHPAVSGWAAKRRKSEVWGVAFSGGADSLALLLLLWAHWPERRDRLVALHFNHRLRGRESLRDEQFCRRVCAGLGIRMIVGAWAVGRALRPTVGRKARPTVSEAEARKARHGFFAKELKKLHCRVLWLAHQQDDIAESMLMRLARGSGAGGLAAPRPVHQISGAPTNVRPLLNLKKTELVAALRAAGAVWREDASNARDDHFRNRIRRHVLPGWVKAAGRDALAGAALARERLEEDEVALEAWLDLLQPLDRTGRLNLALLAGKPRALTRRALHRWLLALKHPPDLSRQGFELLLTAIERGQPTRFSLGAKGFALIRRGQLTYQLA